MYVLEHNRLHMAGWPVISGKREERRSWTDSVFPRVIHARDFRLASLIGSADLVVISDKTDVIKILAKVIPCPLGLLFFEILRRLPTVT